MSSDSKVEATETPEESKPSTDTPKTTSAKPAPKNEPDLPAFEKNH